MVLSLAAGSDDQVSLVQTLHHLLCLVETNVVEVGVGNHTLYVCWTDRGEANKQYKDSDEEGVGQPKRLMRRDLHSPESTSLGNPVIILTCSLLFLFELLLVFLVFGLCVEVVVAVFGELPLIGLVHQI